MLHSSWSQFRKIGYDLRISYYRHPFHTRQCIHLPSARYMLRVFKLTFPWAPPSRIASPCTSSVRDAIRDARSIPNLEVARQWTTPVRQILESFVPVGTESTRKHANVPENTLGEVQYGENEREYGVGQISYFKRFVPTRRKKEADEGFNPVVGDEILKCRLTGYSTSCTAWTKTICQRDKTKQRGNRPQSFGMRLRDLWVRGSIFVQYQQQALHKPHRRSGACQNLIRELRSRILCMISMQRVLTFPELINRCSSWLRTYVQQ